MIQLEVIGPDQMLLAGINTSTFSITVGSQLVNPPLNPADNAIVASTYNAGNICWCCAPPTTPAVPSAI